MALVPSLRRFIGRNLRSCIRASYRHYDAEPGGEEIKSTRVTILSKEDDDNLYVEAYSEAGFRLSNGFRILGPCVLFPRSVLHWAINGVQELNEQSLALFPILEPKLDILILGIGEHGAKYDKNIIKYLRSHRINVEILPTDQACSTFNFLNAERRVVAAGLIPPTFLQFENEDLLVQAQIDAQKSMYELEHGYSGSAYDNVPGELAKNLEIIEEHMYSKLGLSDKKEEAAKKKLAADSERKKLELESKSEDKKSGKDENGSDGGGKVR